jgi:hypothetical protein
MKNLELMPPAEMSAAARAAKITTILAAAIVRTHATDKPKQSANELVFLPDQSVHTTPYQKKRL